MIRIAIVLVTNPRGEYFVHRRAENKPVFPGLWGAGAGGRIEDGEAPLQGAARELAEETGLATPISPIASFPFESGGVHYTVFAYHTESDAPIENHDAEWSESHFASRAQVLAMLAAGEFCPDTAECLRRFWQTNT